MKQCDELYILPMLFSTLTHGQVHKTIGHRGRRYEHCLEEVGQAGGSDLGKVSRGQVITDTCIAFDREFGIEQKRIITALHFLPLISKT